MKNNRAFTLVELLIVVGLLAVLASVSAIILNPAQLLAQGRDSTRINDMDSINRALALTNLQSGINLGDVSKCSGSLACVIYISIPDTSSTCANLGLPDISPESYRCVTSSNLRKTDGSGWMPINFQSLSTGSPFSKLPVDPVNSVSSGFFYTYAAGSWHLTAKMESSKYRSGGSADVVTTDGGLGLCRYEVGTDFALTPQAIIGGSCVVAVGGPSVATAAASLASSTQISQGFGHTCALIQGGTVQCWGRNGSGQLGDGSTTNRLAPASVSGLSGTVTQASSGNDYTCALIQGGTVQCWGVNSSGQLGDGSTTNRLTPVSVTGLSGVVVQIDNGSWNTCALIQGGTVQCWGYNGDGQLGNGTITNSSTPVSVTGLSGIPTQISSGSGHTCALIQGGTVQCWGRNGFGQLGNGTITNSSTPVSVTGLSGTVTQVSSDSYHTCALIQGGTVQCWGYNSYGQIGDGTITNRSTPVSVTGLSGIATQISSGGHHTCALIQGGTVQCWGYNEFGQLGDGTITNRSTPVSVISLLGSVAQTSFGMYHTCALIQGNVSQCWGENSYGQLGDGTITNRSTPVSVSGLPVIINGLANPNGLSTTGWFRYGSTDPGSCNDTFGTRAPSSGGNSLGGGTSSIAYSQLISGFTKGSTYYFCAIASSSSGTAFGSVLNFVEP